jgi:uncharacterized protein YjbI with pentapeptide repeats
MIIFMSFHEIYFKVKLMVNIYNNLKQEKIDIIEQKILEQLQEEFAKIADISQPLHREYILALLEQESEKYGLSKESYRRLFEVYIQEKQNSKEPQKRYLPILTSSQFKLIRKCFFCTLEKSVLISAAIGLFFYIWEAPIRQKQEHYQIWQMVNAAGAQEGGGGRIDALQDLNKDGVSLNGLIAKQANLSGIQLQKADLTFANLQDAILTCKPQENKNKKCSNLEGADLSNANLKGTNFKEANLKAVNFEEVNLEEANLIKADLQRANFFGANLKKAKLLFTQLQGANLTEVNLQEAKLEGANLKKANLLGADLNNSNFLQADLQAANLQATNLQGANFRLANLQGSDLEGANLEQAQQLTPEQVKSAKNWDKAHYDPTFREKLGLPPELPTNNKANSSSPAKLPIFKNRSSVRGNRERTSFNKETTRIRMRGLG